VGGRHSPELCFTRGSGLPGWTRLM
jgi:hypothetical protein